MLLRWVAIHLWTRPPSCTTHWQPIMYLGGNPWFTRGSLTDSPLLFFTFLYSDVKGGQRVNFTFDNQNATCFIKPKTNWEARKIVPWHELCFDETRQVWNLFQGLRKEREDRNEKNRQFLLCYFKYLYHLD